MAAQPALEALPLILEPESRMYCSPVVVLDFQSLYPSLIIAYNLCYTTCLGRKQHLHASECSLHTSASAPPDLHASEQAISPLYPDLCVVVWLII